MSKKKKQQKPYGTVTPEQFKICCEEFDKTSRKNTDLSVELIRETVTSAVANGILKKFPDQAALGLHMSETGYIDLIIAIIENGKQTGFLVLSTHGLDTRDGLFKFFEVFGSVPEGAKVH